MTLREKVMNFFTGRCLRRAEQDLQDSSQWSRDKIQELMIDARLHREREELALEETKRVLAEIEGNDGA